MNRTNMIFFQTNLRTKIRFLKTALGLVTLLGLFYIMGDQADSLGYAQGLPNKVRGKDPQNSPNIDFQPKLRFPGSNDLIYSIRVSPDGKAIYAACFDKSIRAYNVADGKLERIYQGQNGHQGMVLQLSMSKNGQYLASGGADNTVRVWSIPSNYPFKEETWPSAANFLIPSTDYKTIWAALADNNLRAEQIADGKITIQIPGNNNSKALEKGDKNSTQKLGTIRSMALAAAAPTIGGGFSNGELRLWNSSNSQPIGQIQAHRTAVTGLQFQPNGSQIYTSGEEGLVKVWQMPITPRKWLAEAPIPPEKFYLAPDGQTFLTAQGNKVRWCESGQGQLRKEFLSPYPVTALALTPNGKEIVAGCNNGYIVIWTGSSGKVQQIIPTNQGKIVYLQVIANGTQIRTGGEDGTLASWTIATTPAKSMQIPAGIQTSLLFANTQKIAVAGQDNIIRIWNRTNNNLERSLSGHAAKILALEISPDQTNLFSAGEDATIRIWKLNGNLPPMILKGHTAPVVSLHWLAATNQLQSIDKEGITKFWQFPLQEHKTIAHPVPILGQQISTDGKLLLTAGADHQLRLWNLVNGQLLKTISANGQAIQSFNLNADGNLIAYATADKQLHIVQNNQPIKNIPLAAPAAILSISANNKTIAVALQNSTLSLFDISSGQEIKKQSVKGNITGLWKLVKSSQLLITTAEPAIAIYKDVDLSLVDRWQPDLMPNLSYPDPDGNEIVIANGKDKVSIWSIKEKKELQQFPLALTAKALAFSADKKQIGIAGENRIHLFDRTGQRGELFDHTGPVTGLAFLPGQNRLLSCGMDKSVQNWGLALPGQYRKEERQFIGWTANFQARLDFNPQGMLEWSDPKSLKVSKSVPIHQGKVLLGLLSADKNQGYSIGLDEKLKIWSAADGKIALEIPLKGILPGSPFLLRASADNRFIAIASRNVVNKKEGNGDNKNAKANEPAILQLFDKMGVLCQQIDLQNNETPNNNQNLIQDLQFLPDNRQVLITCENGYGEVQSIAYQESRPVAEKGLQALAYIENGQHIISIGKDKFIHQRTLANAKEVHTFGPFAGPIQNFALSNDFQYLAGSSGQQWRLWQISTGKEMAQATLPAAITSLAFGAQNQLGVGSADGWIQLYDAQTWKEGELFAGAGPVIGIAFTPQQPLFLAVAGNQISLNKSSLLRVLSTGDQSLRTLEFNPNTGSLFAGGDDGILYRWNTGSFNPEGKWEKPPQIVGNPSVNPMAITALAVDKTKQLIAIGRREQSISLHQATDGKLLTKIKVPGQIVQMVFDPVKPVLLAALNNNEIWAMDVNGTVGQPLPESFGNKIQMFPVPAGVEAMTVDNKQIVYTISKDKIFRQWKLAASEPIRVLNVGSIADSVELNKDGTLILSGSHEGQLRVNRVADGAELNLFPAHTQVDAKSIYSVRWAPNEQQVLSASYDRSMKLWDLASKKMVREFKGYTPKTFEKGHREAIFSAEFSKDGQFVVSASSDNTLKLWKTADATIVREFINPKLPQPPMPEPGISHPGWVYRAQFANNDRWIISAGLAPRQKGYLAIWNVADGKLLFGEELSIGPVYDFVITPDGNYLLTACGKSPANGQIDNAIYLLPMPIRP